MTTFADLGCSFPLFEAPISDAADLIRKATCSFCASHVDVGFELGIGAGVILNCPSCAALNGLDADESKAGACRACRCRLDFPKLEKPLIACYPCLRQGRAAITKDTELGMTSWEQAFEGVTHGRPGLSRPDFELVPLQDDWIGARLPQATMFELLRTPTYLTIQGDQWLFCCKDPMVFLGTWSRDQFAQHAPAGDGRPFFDSTVEDAVPGLWEDELHDDTGIYMFRCRACRRHRAHWDLA